ncbi:MAG: SIR2 family protein [Anaeromyxobacter sp.]
MALPLGEVQDHLLGQLARGQLLLLVGAGASRWAGLPSWREVAITLAEELVPVLRERVPQAGRRFAPPRRDDAVGMETLLRIPETYRALLGAERLESRLAQLFDTGGVDPTRLPLHRELVRLARYVPAVYTTNFDDLLERSFAAAGWRVQVVASAEDLRGWRFDPSGKGRYSPRFPVYKLHGTLNRPGSMVIGESDFLRRSDLASHPIDLRFCSDVVGRELLLVGYGFQDPNLRWIWAKLRDLAVPPRAWFLELGRSSDLDRVSAELEGMERIDLEVTDPVHPPELLAFLGSLAARCERELGD